MSSVTFCCWADLNGDFIRNREPLSSENLTAPPQKMWWWMFAVFRLQCPKNELLNVHGRGALKLTFKSSMPLQLDDGVWLWIMSFSTFIKDDPVSYAKGGSKGSTGAPFLSIYRIRWACYHCRADTTGTWNLARVMFTGNGRSLKQTLKIKNYSMKTIDIVHECLRTTFELHPLKA